ncbi:MAG: phage holin, LLH family [Tissierellia bacterium]|nr:phage holin, LLH family [Tissierellia bacterium]
MDITILRAIWAIIGIIIVTAMNKVLTETSQILKVRRIVNSAILATSAAEQIWKQYKKAGDEKNKYVMDILKNKFPEISEEELEMFLESAVDDINRWKEEVLKIKEGEE